MVVAGVHHVSLNVTDVERAVGFYCDTLGVRVLPRPDLGVAGAWLELPDGRQIHLIQAPLPTQTGQHVAFAVDDIDAATAHLTALGIEVLGPRPVGTARQAFFADPDGNRLELNQPAVAATAP